MAKFYGEIGYVDTVETPGTGVWETVVTEYPYYGDITQNVRRAEEWDEVNKNVITQNLISVVADAYANEHFFAIRYVKWAGALWEVTTVTVQSPRLILRLGGVYNGPTPPATP